MRSSISISRRMHRAMIPAVLVLLLGYFLVHSIMGQLGFLALRDLSRQTDIMERKAAQIAQKRAALEARVALLRPDHLDPDMLDEQVRRSLGFVHQDEILILNPDDLIAPH
ncbi:cell division protein [Iodidimonas nitroreducens]|uniref:Cell division protein n=2 Tax=Iodidimonas nitroreducens TaxID=1236968 RepID=A0A5A7N467_9PROT|nr:putative protein [alpha proteobacterium Q-1]GER03062.1 cell division protein [Iodidimonas nitroreducens]